MKELETLSDGLDHDPEAKRLAAERLARLKEEGYSVVRGWGDGPDMPFARHVDIASRLRYYDTQTHGHLLDHRYRVLNEGKVVAYVSEPYSVDVDLRDFARLDADGWRISICAWNALWFPGYTVAVTFTRREAK